MHSIILDVVIPIAMFAVCLLTLTPFWMLAGARCDA